MVFCYQNGSDLLWEIKTSDHDFFLKFEAEGREFAIIWRSLEQFVQAGQKIFVTEWFFNFFLMSLKLEQL